MGGFDVLALWVRSLVGSWIPPTIRRTIPRLGGIWAFQAARVDAESQGLSRPTPVSKALGWAVVHRPKKTSSKKPTPPLSSFTNTDNLLKHWNTTCSRPVRSYYVMVLLPCCFLVVWSAAVEECCISLWPCDMSSSTYLIH